MIKRIALIIATTWAGLVVVSLFLDVVMPPAMVPPPAHPSPAAMLLWTALFAHLLHRLLTGRWRWWGSARGDGGAAMKGRLSLGQMASGVAGLGLAIWLGDYLFPDAASSMGHALFAAAKGTVGLCLGLAVHELALSFRSWLPK